MIVLGIATDTCIGTYSVRGGKELHTFQKLSHFRATAKQ